jgi:dTDP-4-amino-4,6-dideoxygalactose transaminase
MPIASGHSKLIIPFNRPYLTGVEERYVLDALHSRAHCGNRTYADRCIALLQAKYGFKSVFLTPSCTAALEMGAILADLHPGDEVILPSWTFSSTANAIVLRGARPVFCEVDPQTLNLDVARVEALITERTRMIAPIDYAGIPCEMDAITALAQKHRLIILQDAAQSLHSTYKGKPCGSAAPMAAFSFHESKNFSCGEGGALVINDPQWIERASILQEKGTDRSKVLRGLKDKYGWVDLGSSFLLADVLAAMLLAQLEHTDEIVARRGEITAAYRQLFAPYEERGCLQIPHPPPYAHINHHAFFVIFDSAENQRRFLQRSNQRGIFPYTGYAPLHSSVMGGRFGYRPEDLPITTDVAARLLRLPFYTDLALEGLDFCIAEFEGILREIYDL